MRVPDPEDEPELPRLAEPVADDGDDAGPADGLGGAAGDLDGEEEGEAVEVPPEGEAEERGGGAAGEHAEGEEAAEVGAVGEVAGGEHGEGVGGEEGEV